MSNIPVTGGSGYTVATETVGGVEFQKVELYGAGGSSVASIAPDGSIKVSVIGTLTVSTHSVAGTVGASIIGTVPVTFVNSSISGQVGASVIGTVPVVQSGTVISSVSGLVVTSPAPLASLVSGVTSVLTGTGQTSVLTAAGTNIKNYITHIIATNAAAVGTFVDIKDGGGNVLYSGYAAASGGGFSATLPAPLVGSANKSVDAQPRVQASIIVAITGFTA